MKNRQSAKTKVGIVGLGYVGLSTAACLVSRGIHVVGVDVEKRRVSSLSKGVVPIHEAGVGALITKALKSGLISFHDGYDAIDDCGIVFITVGTPGLPGGSIDTGYVEAAAATIGSRFKSMEGYPVVVIKSTVIPSTTRTRVLPILEKKSGMKCGRDFGLVTNPEFLREGKALWDMIHPDAIVIGKVDQRSVGIIKSLYRKVYRTMPPFLVTDAVNAEFIKYGVNSIRAVQLSFINTLANMCSRKRGAEVDEVMKGLLLVTHLDKRYSRAGLGFGGSCVPPSTKVQTGSGLKAISEVVLGDEVLSHDGRFHNVTQVYSRQYVGELIEIRGRGFHSFPILCTPEHPILLGKRIHRGDSRWYSNGGRKKLKNAIGFSEPAFIQASEVEHGDLLYLPVPVPTVSRVPIIPYSSAYHHRVDLATVAAVAVTPELQYLFGVYLAEGMIWDWNIYWSLHGKEGDILEELDAITSKFFGHRTSVKAQKGNSLLGVTSSKPLAMYLEETFGKLAWRKRVPVEWVVSLPEEQLINLLRGLIRGDGSNTSHRYDYTTTSESLWNFVQLSFLRLRVPFSVHRSPAKIDSDGVRHREAFTIRVTDIDAMRRIVHDRQRIERVRKKYKVSGFETRYFAFPVRSTSRIPYHGEVRNLEVKESNSYVLQGGIVHNCLPKDLSALIAVARSLGVDEALLRTAVRVNKEQAKEAIILAESLIGPVRGRRVALLGLTFKAGTDDTRESVGIRLARRLVKMGAEVRAYDPGYRLDASSGEGFRLAKRVEDCLRGADCCIVTNEWEEFKKIRPSDFRRSMRRPAVVDGRGMFDVTEFEKEGVLIRRIGVGPTTRGTSAGMAQGRVPEVIH
jgi:UDP-glucose 6-dehydrogenase